MEKKLLSSTPSKKQVAYDGIKEIIVNGKVKKDAPLVERQLCEIIGISRTPVREALRELANDGLVQIIEGKGVYVKKIEFRDMIEIFEMREALERMAMKLFMERLQEEKIHLFQQYMQEQEEAYKKDEHEAFMAIDMKIHNTIADGSQNVRLKNAISTIYGQIKQMAISAKDDAAMREIAIRAHRKMLDAILKGDSGAAQEAIVEHIIEVKNIHRERYYLL